MPFSCHPVVATFTMLLDTKTTECCLFTLCVQECSAPAQHWGRVLLTAPVREAAGIIMSSMFVLKLSTVPHN